MLHVVHFRQPLRGGQLAKEPEETQTEVSQRKTPDQRVMELMTELLKRGGINLTVQGQENPVEFRDVTLTDLKIDSAWIRIGLGGCILRTDTINDRAAFLSWVDTGGCGKLNAKFSKVTGKLPEPEVAESRFKPRSRGYDQYRRGAYDEMRRQLNMAN